MRRFGLSFLFFLAAWASLETIVASLELLVPSEFRDRHMTLFHLFEPHPDLGFRTRPNLNSLEVNWRNDSLTGTYSTDAFGFRNVGRDYESSEIYFIGDSFTWGSWVPRKDTFPDRIGLILGVEISNLGQESYYIEQYLKVARAALARGKPRKVVICLFANDLTAPLSDDELTNFYQRFQWDQYRYYPFYKKTLIYQAAHSFRGLVDNTAVVFGWRSGPPLSHLDRAIHSTGMEFYRQLGVHPEYFSQSLNVAIEAKFRLLIQEIKTRGAEPVVFLLPSKESAYKRTYKKLFSGDYLSIEETSYSRLCSIAKKKDVICVDLTSAFRKRSQLVDTYFHNDPHWNMEGHRFATTEMVPHLQ
jgi:hypothetical protein